MNHIDTRVNVIVTRFRIITIYNIYIHSYQCSFGIIKEIMNDYEHDPNQLIMNNRTVHS